MKKEKKKKKVVSLSRPILVQYEQCALRGSMQQVFRVSFERFKLYRLAVVNYSYNWK